MVRWAWRLFRREWRQQLLILLLVIVAVAAVVVGAAVAINTPPPANAGFGTAHDLATFTTSGKQPLDLHSVDAQIAALEHRFGTVQVIENETFSVPGSTQTYQLRSQDPHGPFGGPMLQLLSGHYPDRAEPDRPHTRAGVRAQSQGGRHLAPRRQDGRRHRAEPPEPARRVRASSSRAGNGPDDGGRPLRRTGRRPGPHRVQRLDAGPVGQQQPHQPRHHRAGVGDGRHAAHRAGVGRRLHGAGAAPTARPRDARVHGGDGPQRPARAASQRRHRRRRRGRGGFRAGLWWRGWPTARTTSRARTTSSRCSPCHGR